MTDECLMIQFPSANRLTSDAIVPTSAADANHGIGISYANSMLKSSEMVQVLLAALVFLCCLSANSEALSAVAPAYGQLSVSGTKLMGNSKQVALHGNSLFWSQWYPQFWNATTLKALKCTWNANVVRAAMGVDQGGYLTTESTQYQLVTTVIEAAISLGMYVIVDWHVSATYTTQAVAFFTKIAKAYGSYPHILYETYNEPLALSWTSDLVPYHKKVIAAIRKYDTKNVIILGTPNWSQDVDVAAANPVSGYSNLMYTFHFYAGTHTVSGLGAKLKTAYTKSLPIFVTEYGACESSGDGTIATSSMSAWWSFLDGYKISYCNWSVCNKGESCSALTTSASASNVGSSSYWTTSGKLIQAYYKKQSNGVSCSG
ncbi:hypothetical protein niasHT_026573 [Heterodera trifolii]|uniref:Glycoside hydrolase family 5 domain-containing protein n=2 Tax=Heterodera trifolii TaxID=157864 RepID=A0ABD2KSC6_9BILA